MFSKENKEKILKFLEKIKKLEILIPIIGIICANLQLRNLIKITNQVSSNFTVYGVILNIVIIYLSIVIYNERKKNLKMNEDITHVSERNKNLTEVNDTIRCFKHDFYNIIQAIDGYITMKNMPALEKYFSKLLDECDYAKNLEFLTAKSVNDPAIYGVLINKYKIAKEHHITMNIDVLADFTNVSEKSYLVSRIIGILLDNAIEAADECQKKSINVQFLQDPEDTSKKIIIENTYENKDVDTDLIFKKEYSSKKAKGNSGLGLWKVRDIIKKESKILLQTTKDSQMFKQQLEIVV